MNGKRYIMNDVVIIKLDKERQLRFGHKALKKVETMLKKPVQAIDTATMSSSDLEVLLLCGLNDPELQLKDMEDLMDMAPYMDLYDALGNALKKAFGFSEKQAAQDDKKK